jgi:hypothetical protein
MEEVCSMVINGIYGRIGQLIKEVTKHVKIQVKIETHYLEEVMKQYM